MLHNDPASYSRLLTGTTLTFHIIFATIGVGVPAMIALAHWIGLKRNDSHLLLLAERWTRGFIVTVAIGVVTGTSIGLQLSLLWPTFMKVAGQIIALPLFMEVFAFFMEAIFLGVYVYGRGRIKNKWLHFLCIVPVAIGSSASALFITIVNAFMNTPKGFALNGETITNIQPLHAMFTPAMPTKVAHVLASAYMTSAFILAAIAAFQLLRGHRHVYYRKALHLTMVTACVFSIITIVIGDFSGKFLAAYQPIKLAAGEWHFETSRHADLVVLGALDSQHHIHGAIRIPSGLSYLAHGTLSAKVLGLNAFNKALWPPLIVHYLFDLMVMIGTLLLILTIWYLIKRVFKKNIISKPLLYAITLSGPFAIIAIELGWMFTEIGRQPWILVGYLKTVHAATTSNGVGTLLILFVLLYVVLGISCALVLRRLFKNNPAEKELDD